MAKSSKTNTELVTEHIQKLPTALQEAVSYLREIILSVDDEIAEQIKWNSPAFYYAGAMQDFDPKEYKRDLIVVHIRKGEIMLVMPTGSALSPQPDLSEQNYKDGRRIVTFATPADVMNAEDALRALVVEWLSRIEK